MSSLGGRRSIRRALARGTDDSGRPATVAEAVDAYERDLIARRGSVANAGRIRKHLTPTLAAKPVGLLTARELAAWRDSLLADGMKSATVVRLCKATKAALNLAARRDRRITNRNEWRDGLSGVAEHYTSRNPQRLTDEKVRAVVAAAYAVDRAFGFTSRSRRKLVRALVRSRACKSAISWPIRHG